MNQYLTTEPVDLSAKGITSPFRPESDPVNRPAHYTRGSVECIDAIKAATMGLAGIKAVCTGNAIKYIWRWHDKGGALDIEKAIWYLQRLKEEISE